MYGTSPPTLAWSPPSRPCPQDISVVFATLPPRLFVAGPHTPAATSRTIQEYVEELVGRAYMQTWSCFYFL
jgi:hypothetical protein